MPVIVPLVIVTAPVTSNASAIVTLVESAELIVVICMHKRKKKKACTSVAVP